MDTILSPLQISRYKYKPKLPEMYTHGMCEITATEGDACTPYTDNEALKSAFPNTYGMKRVYFRRGENQAVKKKLNVGVILSGGQAPGGHNVITGLYDALKEADPENKLLGFKNGPSGLLNDDYIEFDDKFIDSYRNTGGFDIIGSGRTKLETEEQFGIVADVCKKHEVSAIVIIGGDDSNTNAAMLAEYFVREKTGVQVIGCPKTIDGDLKNENVEISFGFDTATKTYSELIGNIERDACSARKYWHFIKVMGRSASHIALECALKTHPNVCIISEEVEAKNTSFVELGERIADSVCYRSDNGENFGVVIIPESLIEFVPELKNLIAELNDILAVNAEELGALTGWKKFAYLEERLTPASYKVFALLPSNIQDQLLMDRDQHGNIQLSKIETEELLIKLVRKRLSDLADDGKYHGTFTPISHFLGYEGRCAFPSNFDADYCYSLGYNAFMLISYNYTGYLSTITNLARPASEWQAGGIPLTGMMNLERRSGKLKPVIKKMLVDLNGAPFKYFVEQREHWAKHTCYTFPGAIQYYGPTEVSDTITKTLELEHPDKRG